MHIKELEEKLKNYSDIEEAFEDLAGEDFDKDNLSFKTKFKGDRYIIREGELPQLINGGSTIEYYKILEILSSVDPINLLPNSNDEEYNSEACQIEDYLRESDDITYSELEDKVASIFFKAFAMNISAEDLHFLTEKLIRINI